MNLRLPAPARREQIIDVGIKVFAQSGFHGTSMNDIADAAGVTKPVLYQHFDSKRDLYLALLDEVGRRMLSAIKSRQEGASDGRSLTELGFRAYFEWVAEDHDAFLLLYGTLAVRKITSEAARSIEPLIAADIDAEHRRTLAHGLVGLAEGVSRHLVERGQNFDPHTLGGQVADLAWAGLRAVH